MWILGEKRLIIEQEPHLQGARLRRMISWTISVNESSQMNVRLKNGSKFPRIIL